MMKAALIDTSSAILLYKADLLDRLVGSYQVRMAEAVYAELTVDDRYPGAVAVRGYRRDRRISVLADGEPADCLERHPELGGLGAGERDTLCRFIEGLADFVIIDDGRGAAWCRDREIPYVNALLIPRLMRLAGRMTHALARRASRRITRVGRYSPEIIAAAAGASPRHLAPFLPDSNPPGYQTSG